MMIMNHDRPPELIRLWVVARGWNRLAEDLGLASAQSIVQWTRVPEHHLNTIYRLYGIHPIELRPDLFEPKPEKVKKVRPRRVYKRGRRWKLQWHEIDVDPLD